jgi:CO dehydrogenase/acetyl-CoA synthase alpha subunit
VFLSRYCICCSGYTHMLQAYVLNVSPVLDICCSKCFYVASVFVSRRGKRGTCGVFHLDVAYVAIAIHVCYKCMF